jgi:hypothetical protein
MNHVTLGLLLGLTAGVVVVALMIPMPFPDKRAALTAAFISRFSIGFLTANLALPVHPIAIKERRNSFIHDIPLLFRFI